MNGRRKKTNKKSNKKVLDNAKEISSTEHNKDITIEPNLLPGKLELSPYYRQGMEYAYTKTSNIIQAFADPITTCTRAYNIAEPLVGNKRLLITLGLEVALLALLSAGTRYMTIGGGANRSALDSMQTYSSEVQMNQIYNYATNMAWYGLGSAILYAGSEVITRMGEMSLKYPILDKRLDRYYNDVNEQGQPIYLSMASYPKASTIIPSDQKNLGSAIRLANSIFVSSAATLINGVYAVSSLYHISNTKEEGLISLNNILGTKLLFALGATLISNYLSQQYFNIKQEVQPFQTSLKEIESGNSINTRQIAQMNAGEFASNQTLSIVNKVRIRESAMTFWETALKTWDKVITNVEPALDYLLALKRSNRLRIGNKEEFARNLLDLANTSKLFNFATTNNAQITELKSALNSLESYEEIKQKAREEKPSFLRHKDRPDKAIHIESGLEIASDEGKIFFRLKKELVLPLTKLTSREEGSRILVHGASGIGKSILLKALANIKTPGAKVTGCFRFPESFDETKADYDNLRPDICTIPQHFYFPARTSFLDIIKFPRINDKQMERNDSIFSFAGMLDSVGSLYPEQLAQRKYNPKKEMKESERVLKIAKNIVDKLGYQDRFRSFFDDPHKEHARWDNLSGGEQKIIPLIIAILAEPKILILDETWVGLDQSRVEKVHELLNKNLPKTCIISVAHHEEKVDLNKPGCFYSHEFELDKYNTIESEQAKSHHLTSPKLSRNYSNIGTSSLNLRSPFRPIARDSSSLLRENDSPYLEAFRAEGSFASRFNQHSAGHKTHSQRIKSERENKMERAASF